MSVHQLPIRSRFRKLLLPLLVIVAVVAMVGFTAQFSFAQSKPAQTPPTSILFENVRIFNGTAPQLSAPSNLLVIDNKIQTISPTAISAPSGSGLTRIKGGGRILMPGLIDNHVHIPLSASSREDLENPNISAEIIQARAIAEAKQMLLRGFTSVRDVGGPIFPLKAAIDQGKAIGPRIYPSGAIISQTSGHGDSRLLSERSRRFGGTLSRSELLNSSFITAETKS